MPENDAQVCDALSEEQVDELIKRLPQKIGWVSDDFYVCWLTFRNQHRTPKDHGYDTMRKEALIQKDQACRMYLYQLAMAWAKYRLTNC